MSTASVSRASRFVEHHPTAFHRGILTPNSHLLNLDQIAASQAPLTLHPTLSITIRAAEKIANYRFVENDAAQEAAIARFSRNPVVVAIQHSLEEHKIYERFNEAVRAVAKDSTAKHIPQLLAYYPVYRDLISMREKVPALPETIQLYRGSSVPLDSPKGSIVSIETFTSTSTDRNVVEAFTGQRGTLLVFTGPGIAGLDLSSISAFPNEAEMLLFPFQSFRVQSIKKNGQQTVITLNSRLDAESKISWKPVLAALVILLALILVFWFQ